MLTNIFFFLTSYCERKNSKPSPQIHFSRRPSPFPLNPRAISGRFPVVNVVASSSNPALLLIQKKLIYSTLEQTLDSVTRRFFKKSTNPSRLSHKTVLALQLLDTGDEVKTLASRKFHVICFLWKWRPFIVLVEKTPMKYVDMFLCACVIGKVYIL